MSDVTIRVDTDRVIADGISRATERALAGEPAETGQVICFSSYELMHKVLAPPRLAIVKAMAGKGALTVREVARLVDRDVKAVHRDLTTLTEAGVIERTDKGVVFAYDRIHFSFSVDAAA